MVLFLFMLPFLALFFTSESKTIQSAKGTLEMIKKKDPPQRGGVNFGFSSALSALLL